jgi:hypothetical protein
LGPAFWPVGLDVAATFQAAADAIEDLKMQNDLPPGRDGDAQN